jgi:hypothetical protein
MSRYVTKKHGLIIGSNNIFAVVNDVLAPAGVERFRDGYNAVVWAKPYAFTTFNTANAQIETPANQLLWHGERIETGEMFAGLAIEGIRYNPSSFVQRWLDTNVGTKHERWDVRTLAERSDRSFFFKRRKDALAFTTMIERILGGIAIET